MRRLDVLGEAGGTQAGVKPKFWRRQFSDDVTPPQLIFDVLFGVLLPTFCFIFDPIVFKNNSGRGSFGPELSQYKLFVYIFSCLSILTLSLWFVLGRRSYVLNGIVAGILLSGSICSLIIGILILPLTLFGLLLLIGVLGFTPFFTSFVYLRNSIRALNRTRSYFRQPKLTALLLLGMILVVSSAVLGQWQITRIVNQSMNNILRGDVQATDSSVKRLRYFGWATDLDQIVWAYYRETDQVRKGNLAEAYKEITGRDIQTRLVILLD